MDLDRSRATIALGAEAWSWRGGQYPYLETCKDRTIYYWTGDAFAPVSRYTSAPHQARADGMGPADLRDRRHQDAAVGEGLSWDDAQRKVGLVQPRGKRVLDTCGGLGYFAEWCLRSKAKAVRSFEKNPDVLWLGRSIPGRRRQARSSR